MLLTNDKIIRFGLKKRLKKKYAKNKKTIIIEELGVNHGVARIDVAVINGVMHGYEIKSDQDTLERLSEQVEEFKRVFDKVTIVVGEKHLHHAKKMVPSWWAITVARVDSNGSIVLRPFRKGEINKKRDLFYLIKLLWRKEALKILEDVNLAKGFYSKPRDIIYDKLSYTFTLKMLSKKIREALFNRVGWR